MPFVVNYSAWSGKDDPDLEQDCLAEVTQRKWGVRDGHCEVRVTVDDKHDFFLRFRVSDLVRDIEDMK